MENDSEKGGVISQKPRPQAELFFVYLLISDDNKSSYVGATIDINRRLRQHNREIKGGARATSRKVLKGVNWTRAIHVSGFPTWQSALQFEWRWKQISRKNKERILPLKKRIIALKKLLSLEKSTEKAIPYSEWQNPPEVHLEIEEANTIYYS